ncbi:MAG: phospholipase D family protein [Sphingobacteriaceae bacterium]|nr:phospholipase D family protein [Sphingobacteriaceae bacterium]
MKRNLVKLSILSILLSSCSEEKIDTIPEQKFDFCKSIHRDGSTSLSKELESLKDSMTAKTGVYVLEDGGSAMIARAWLSEYAEKTIDIQYFIFSTDNVGLIACDYLVRAADRGVKVRILVDDIMVEAGIHDILTMDSHENIDIRIYNPGANLGKSILQKLTKLKDDFKGFNQRMHNKTFTVDGKVVITGGRNIADEYFDYDHDYNFRDRDIMLLGKGVQNVSTSFEQFWNDTLSVPVNTLVKEEDINLTNPSRYDRLHQYACNPENFWPQVRERIQNLPQAFKNIQASGDLVWMDNVSFVSDAPGKNRENLGTGGITTDTLMKLLMSAKTSIDIQSPYLITTKVGQSLMRNAVKRGVKVRILTNSLCSTDNMEAFGAYQECRTELLKTGIRIFEFKPDAVCRFKMMTGALQKELKFKPIFGLHAKSMVIDGETTVVGTFNLDPRSAYYNTECVTIVRNKKIATSVLNEMEEELKPENAWETTLKFNPDSFAGDKQKKTWKGKILPKAIL